MKPKATPHRIPTFGEEAANFVSHGLGLVIAIGFAPFLITAAAQRGTAADVTGASLFAATVILLYLASTLYHALPPNRAKHILRLIDHGSIFLLIAGTYTPFTLGVLRGPWGWSLFGVVWSLAAVGILMKVFGGASRFPKLSLGLYLLMGWLAVIAVQPLWQRMPSWGLFWLAAGGLSYTGGVIFYAAEQMRYGHFVWHLFVLAGTLCHLIAVYGYAVAV